MVDDYLADLHSKGYAESTITLSGKWLEHFLKRCPKPLRELRKRDLTRYHQSLQWEPGPSGKLYSESTRNQAVGVLKSYFRWCVSSGYLKDNPAGHLVTRRPPAKERIRLTPSEAQAVLQLPKLDTFIGLRDRGILGLIIENEASPGALFRLDITDFQADTGALLLKGRKRRIVSLSSGLQGDLERYLRLGRMGVVGPEETGFFVTQKGLRLGAHSHRLILQKYCREARVFRPSYRM